MIRIVCLTIYQNVRDRDHYLEMKEYVELLERPDETNVVFVRG